MKNKRLLTMALALVMTASLLTGCGKQAQVAETPAPAEEAPAPAEEAPADTAFAKRADDEAFTITDMAGREVSFDHAITKAFAANPMGQVLIQTMNWDLLAGYNNPVNDNQKNLIPEKYRDLPNLGNWAGATPTANIEEIVKSGTEVILVTQIQSEKVLQLAENIQNQTGIPTVFISVKLDDIADSYKLLGELFNDPERGNEMAEYVETELNELKDLVAKIPAEDNRTIFYSEGADALETDPAGSFHTELFDFLGLVNVADVSVNTTNGFVGQTVCSLEQIISWDPEYIIRNMSQTGTSENVTVADILSNPDWQGITAVKNQNVYQTPAMPFNWVDRPPSMIRILGIKWLGNLLYPDIFDYDIKEEAKEFFKFTMNVELNDKQLENILANSLAK